MMCCDLLNLSEDWRMLRPKLVF
uniref:Uncharacterized protein n=1 Tax=Arundo donax TaxID=35708 RepID=A0A0A9FF29_ARUDO